MWDDLNCSLKVPLIILGMGQVFAAYPWQAGAAQKNQQSGQKR